MSGLSKFSGGGFSDVTRGVGWRVSSGGSAIENVRGLSNRGRVWSSEVYEVWVGVDGEGVWGVGRRMRRVSRRE